MSATKPQPESLEHHSYVGVDSGRPIILSKQTRFAQPIGHLQDGALNLDVHCRGPSLCREAVQRTGAACPAFGRIIYLLRSTREGTRLTLKPLRISATFEERVSCDQASLKWRMTSGTLAIVSKQD